jgi:hypothetical protein
VIGGDLSNHQYGHLTPKNCLLTYIDTALDDTSNEPAVKVVNGDTEGMDVDADVEEVNNAEKNADLEVEDQEADEEVSQQDEDAQPIDDAGEGDDEPVDLEGAGDGYEDQDQDLETNEVENENDNENENDEENEEEPLPDGDLEDQEIELQERMVQACKLHPFVTRRLCC